MTKTIHIFLKKRPGKAKDADPRLAKLLDLAYEYARKGKSAEEFERVLTSSDAPDDIKRKARESFKSAKAQGTEDAGFTTYDPREVNRLRAKIKELKADPDYVPAGMDKVKRSKELHEQVKELEKELSKYHDAEERYKGYVLVPTSGSAANNNLRYSIYSPTSTPSAAHITGVTMAEAKAWIERHPKKTEDALSPAEQSELSTIQQAMEKLDKEIERKEDQGVTVLPADRQKLAEMARKIHQLTMKSETKDSADEGKYKRGDIVRRKADGKEGTVVNVQADRGSSFYTVKCKTPVIGDTYTFKAYESELE